MLNKRGNNYGLLVAALVAIVAIVGLVMFFKGGPSGQAYINVGPTPTYNQGFSVADRGLAGAGEELGLTAGDQCSQARKERNQCCRPTCAALCKTGRSDVCWQTCTNRCEREVAEGLAVAGLGSQ